MTTLDPWLATLPFVWASESKKLLQRPAGSSRRLWFVGGLCGACAPSSGTSEDDLQQGSGFFLLRWGWRVGWDGGRWGGVGMGWIKTPMQL